MTIWDDRILELASNQNSVKAAELKRTDYFHISRAQISRRLKRLSEKGLLDDFGNGVYVITSDGIDYLNGDLDASKLDGESDGENTNDHAEA
jgi:predicted transcriptional regulator